MFIKKISEAKKRYYKLILLVGTHGSGKTVFLKKILQELQGSIINLNYEMSERLHDIPQNEWNNHIDPIIGELLPVNDQPILIDNIEILFSPEFQLNPLQILKRLSRTRVVIASWPGSYSDGQLTHGNMNNGEYFVANGAEIADIEICSLPVEG